MSGTGKGDTMSYYIPENITDLFQYRCEESLELRTYMMKPEKIGSMNLLKDYDRRVEEEIKTAQKYIELLQEYRKLLFERSKAVTSATYTLKLTFYRKHNYYDNHIEYHIMITKVFSDSTLTEETVLKEYFAGKDRFAAIKRYKELLKQHPNIETTVDIKTK